MEHAVSSDARALDQQLLNLRSTGRAPDGPLQTDVGKQLHGDGEVHSHTLHVRPIMPTRGKVLVIDDDMWIGGVIADFLRDQGFAAEQAADGTPACRWLN